MKTFFFSFICLVLFADNNSLEAWSLKKDKDNIAIYTREITTSPFKEFKAVSVLDTNFDDLLHELLTAPKYLPSCNFGMSYKVPNEDSKTHIFYYKQDLPWPLKDRDVLTKLTLKERSEEAILLEISVAEDVINTPKGTTRIKQLKGFWKLEKHPKGIKATQQIHMDPGGKVPPFIVNPLIVKGPFKTFKDLHQKLSSSSH